MRVQVEGQRTRKGDKEEGGGGGKGKGRQKKDEGKRREGRRIEEGSLKGFS